MPEVEAFLTHLAVNRGVGAVSQNQALNALVFLYREVLKIELEGIEARRAKHTRRLPIVLTTGEVGELLKAVKGEHGLVGKLLNGWLARPPTSPVPSAASVVLDVSGGEPFG